MKIIEYIFEVDCVVIAVTALVIMWLIELIKELKNTLK